MKDTQLDVDRLIMDYFDKKAQVGESGYDEDMQPQPFSQLILIQYFLDKYNRKYGDVLSDADREKYSLEIALKVKEIMAMNTLQVKEYFRRIDEERIEETIRQNDRVVFDFCLIREISARKDLVGQAREDFRSQRVAAYLAGEFDYDVNAKRSEEILIRMEDLHFPEGSKKLKDVDTSSTYEELLKKQMNQLGNNGVTKK